jgi:hypothetical protein
MNELTHEVMRLLMPPPEPGDQVIIDGWEHIKVIVLGAEWIKKEGRYKISLDWGDHGFSYVYDHDEGTVWRRFLEVN